MGWRALEAGDFVDTSRVWGKQTWGEIEGAAAGGLVDSGCFGAEFASDVSRGGAAAYQEDILHVLFCQHGLDQSQ